MSYLEELLSLNDKSVLKQKALEYCKKMAKKSSEYAGFTYLPAYFKRWGGTGGAGSCIHSVFGEFNWDWEHYTERRIKGSNFYNFRWKCGIEILGAKPNATGRTYSNSCKMTVKELKDACKMNNIKPVGNKKDLLHALMKI